MPLADTLTHRSLFLPTTTTTTCPLVSVLHDALIQSAVAKGRFSNQHFPVSSRHLAPSRNSSPLSHHHSNLLPIIPSHPLPITIYHHPSSISTITHHSTPITHLSIHLPLSIQTLSISISLPIIYQFIYDLLITSVSVYYQSICISTGYLSISIIYQSIIYWSSFIYMHIYQLSVHLCIIHLSIHLLSICPSIIY